jgi:FlaA1/EpsC-like NDP-sugar epimerase
LYKLIKLNNFDGIIHLAAISRVVVAENNQEECIRTNVYGTKTLIEVLEKKRLE